MTRYSAHISHKGKIRYGDVPGSIGVLEALDKFMPIGEASCRTHDENGLAVGPSGSARKRFRADGSWSIVSFGQRSEITSELHCPNQPITPRRFCTPRKRAHSMNRDQVWEL